MNLWYRRDDPIIFNQIFSSHIGLCKTVTLRYARPANEFLFDDLYQECQIALINCIRAFDVNRGFSLGAGSFSAYAYHAMKNRIINYFKENRQLDELTDVASPADMETDCANKINYEAALKLLQNIRLADGTLRSITPRELFLAQRQWGMRNILKRIRKNAREEF